MLLQLVVFFAAATATTTAFAVLGGIRRTIWTGLPLGLRALALPGADAERVIHPGDRRRPEPQHPAQAPVRPGLPAESRAASACLQRAGRGRGRDAPSPGAQRLPEPAGPGRRQQHRRPRCLATPGSAL